MGSLLKDAELVLKSNPKNITRIEPLIDELKDEYDISDEIYSNMLVVMTEAVNNAIMHGNQADESKQVKISHQKEDKALTFFVEDEGPGFDYNNLPDPTKEENLDKPNGRGVFLMTQLSDLISFSDNGSKVELQFKL